MDIFLLIICVIAIIVLWPLLKGFALLVLLIAAVVYLFNHSGNRRL